jgi:hypothetical protein
MNEALIVLSPEHKRAAQKAHQRVASPHGRVQQRYGPAVLIVEAEPDLLQRLADDKGVAGVFTGLVPPDVAGQLDETGRLGIAAWNQRHSAEFAEAKHKRKGEGLAWDHPGYEPEGRQEP